MTNKPNGKQSVTIDISDLCGTYSLNEIPTLLGIINRRMEEAQNQDLIYIKKLDNISPRLKNSLLRADFDTLNEVCLFTKNKLMDYNGIGKTSIAELEEILSRYNLQLKKMNR
jgi:DNA-directed RNA polymerase alpha subunit